jgi:hypothetical protein
MCEFGAKVRQDWLGKIQQSTLRPDEELPSFGYLINRTIKGLDLLNSLVREMRTGIDYVRLD